MKLRHRLFVGVSLLAAPPLPLHAQQVPPADGTATTGPAPRPEDDFHGRDIIVTAPYRERLDLFGATSVLSGPDLAQAARAQIGETLTDLPGVSATSFAPGSSRPVLRGFQANRIAVLTDGLASLDASTTSTDHGVTLDPLTAERIEVLQGPAVLLFGGQAVGGAVNVLDKRIPRAIPERPFHIDAVGGYGSAAEDWSAAGSLDVPIGDRFVVHVDGSYRDTEDLRTGGYLLSAPLRAEQRAVAAEELEEGNDEEAAEANALADARGRLPNSAVRIWTFGTGAAFIDEGGSLGVSYSIYDTRYGVPERPGAGHHHEGEADGDVEVAEEEGDVPVSIAMRQERVDFRGGLNFASGPFQEVKLRAGFADYEHTEFEGEEVGTVFSGKGIEARAELVQRRTDGGWGGVTGVSFFTRDYGAVGEEAFIPTETTTRDWGVFTLQELKLGGVDFEASLRYDAALVRSEERGFDRDFDSISAAVGFGLPFGDWRFGGSLSRTERAPTLEELLSNGAHIATQAFEIGNPDFTTEKAWNGELSLRYDTPGLRFAATAFANRFDDFIIDVATGEEDAETELPIFRYIQTDADYWGVTLEAGATVARVGGFEVGVDGVADYVRATLDDGTPVPRIPPLRLLGGVELRGDAVELRGEVEWADDQDRVPDTENPTDGFTFVNLSAAWRPLGRGGGITLTAAANNLFDVEARRAASVTRDFIPLPGRDIRLGVQLSF